eukprot:scaffold2947_cov67-Phaeocystis_antarctica.AAC.8
MSRTEGRVARPRATDQQLVGNGQGVCVLPSRKEGTRCGVSCRPGDGRAWACGGASGMHGSGPTQACGGQGPRGAHGKHKEHVRDGGRVEAQRLVESIRPLPRVGRRAYGTGRGVGREAVGDRGARSVRRGRDCRLGAGHGEERT